MISDDEAAVMTVGCFGSPCHLRPHHRRCLVLLLLLLLLLHGLSSCFVTDVFIHREMLTGYSAVNKLLGRCVRAEDMLVLCFAPK